MADDITETSQTVAAGQLRAFIERIERLEEEKKTIADDIKEVYAEAKGTGFDTKAMRTIIRLRKKDQAGAAGGGGDPRPLQGRPRHGVTSAAVSAAGTDISVQQFQPRRLRPCGASL